jgi:hypothetical protein
MTNLEPDDGDDDGDKGGGRKRKKMSAQELADRALEYRARRPRRVLRVPARIARPDPVLSAALAGAGTEGPCGSFTRVRNWQVTNGRSGLIIQKITRTFTVQVYDPTSSTWAMTTGAALNTYVTDPGSTVSGTDLVYWEAWRVRADGSVINGTDQFVLCGLIPTAASHVNTTRGYFTITGEAFFYPTDDSPADLNFTASSVVAAGVLPARTTDPAGDLTGRGIAAVGAAVTYSVTATWDSTWTAPVPTSPTPFTPPGAISVIT